VEQALGITLIQYHNQYRGAYYGFGCINKESFVLQRNWNPLDEEFMEEQFLEMKILLYVNASNRAEELEQLLTMKTTAQLLVRQEEP
jgi:hypothetical protein